MKKIAILGLVLVALVSLTGCASTQPVANAPVTLKVGTFVAVQWQDSSYYLATIKAVGADGKYAVKFTDDTEGNYGMESLVVVPVTLAVKAGDAVMAAYSSSGKFYPAKVTAVNDLGIMVAWDDGSADSLLPQGRMFLGTVIK